MNRALVSCGKTSHGSKQMCLEMLKMMWERTEKIFEEIMHKNCPDLNKNYKSTDPIVNKAQAQES